MAKVTKKVYPLDLKNVANISTPWVEKKKHLRSAGGKSYLS